MITKPTKVTEEQYNNSIIAIDEETFDHWLINKQEGICLWVGQYPDNREEVMSDLMELVDGDFRAIREVVTVVGENGEDVDIEAIVYETKNSPGDIDLFQLERGKIQWF